MVCATRTIITKKTVLLLLQSLGQSKPKKGKSFQCGERGHKAKDCNKKIQQSAVTDAQIEIVEEEEIEVNYILLSVSSIYFKCFHI